MKLRNIVLAVVVAFSFPALTFAGVANTVHNLGTSNNGAPSSNGGIRNEFSGTAEICVFCHTPHGGDTSAAVPLWNRSLPATSTFQTYDTLGTTTLDAEIASVGSVSIACLSCHDGTQALDSVINDPGSGLVTAFSTSGAWTGGDLAPDGSLAVGIVQNIGTDLRNDHPIGVQYGGGGIDTGNTMGATNDADFYSPNFETVAGKPVWWVDADNDGIREKTDVSLYTRNDFTGANQEPSVECASCHDPHTEANSTFLRVTNVGSALCLTCHNK